MSVVSSALSKEESIVTTSWLDIDPDSDFSLANIPFGIVSTPNESSPHAAVAIGSFVVDLKALFFTSTSATSRLGEVFPSLSSRRYVFTLPTLNAFAQLGRTIHREVRAGVQTLLRADTPYPDVLRDNAVLRNTVILRQSEVKMHLPMAIGDYTDFYAGYHHAYAVGKMFRGAANAIQPNYNHLPVGYHGRSSSIVVSGTPIRRPVGQIIRFPKIEPRQPTAHPSEKMDFELELGCFLARSNEMGSRVDIAEAEEYIFGYVLLNDWSARDIQSWEYVPLGPFNSKNFASTISPWIVLADALEPFRSKGIANLTTLQGYLKETRVQNVFDIKLEVALTSKFTPLS